tara:strand:- start:867 stop:1709 length:843 start_codon:yes stop_codon:yes gene_type:complete
MRFFYSRAIWLLRSKSLNSKYENFSNRLLIYIIRYLKKIKCQINKLPQQNSIDDFLATLFSKNENLKIIQIGANDGISSDPLFKYVKNYKGKILLIEAIPYYCEKLKKTYAGNPNIIVCNKLVDSTKSEKKFFYIDPLVADEMNGNGPFNQWAHCQGSTEKENIIYNIKYNRFRGKNYRKNINKYIKSIKEIDIKSIPLDELISEHDGFENCIDLMVLDVQGAEFSILKNLNSMKIKPKFLIYEDDGSMSSSDSKNLYIFLISLGYFLIVDGHDKAWIKL